MEILVFKTNASEHQLPQINQCLETIPGSDSWNFDLEDIDRILRVKAAYPLAKEVEQTLQSAGYHCTELPD